VARRVAHRIYSEFSYPEKLGNTLFMHRHTKYLCGKWVRTVTEKEEVKETEGWHAETTICKKCEAKHQANLASKEKQNARTI
jgi:hypothetical protein